MYNRYNRERQSDLNDGDGSDLDDFLASDNEEEDFEEEASSTAGLTEEEEEEEEWLESAILAALPCTAQHISKSRGRQPGDRSMVELALPSSRLSPRLLLHAGRGRRSRS